MAEQPNISSILAALGEWFLKPVRYIHYRQILTFIILAAQRGVQPQGGQPQPPYQQQPGLPQGYPGAYGSPAPPPGAGGFSLPQPTNSGSLDLSSIKPVNSGTVSIAEAIAKARGIAAEKGVSYDSHGGSGRSK
jgi:far upstream element-binding protein